jgi:hypothetical protein
MVMEARTGARGVEAGTEATNRVLNRSHTFATSNINFSAADACNNALGWLLRQFSYHFCFNLMVLEFISR